MATTEFEEKPQNNHSAKQSPERDRGDPAARGWLAALALSRLRGLLSERSVLEFGRPDGNAQLGRRHRRECCRRCCFSQSASPPICFPASCSPQPGDVSRRAAIRAPVLPLARV